MFFVFRRQVLENHKQKTPPDGEKGGEKQYKDYEKNPTLFFLNASASKSDAKISIIFIHGTIFGNFFEFLIPKSAFRDTIHPIVANVCRVHAPAITAWRP